MVEWSGFLLYSQVNLVQFQVWKIFVQKLITTGGFSGLLTDVNDELSYKCIPGSQTHVITVLSMD